MITYEPFWNTLKAKNVSTYQLIKDHHISSSLINRLRHNQPVSTTTLNDLCLILECNLSDVAVFEAIEKRL